MTLKRGDGAAAPTAILVGSSSAVRHATQSRAHWSKAFKLVGAAVVGPGRANGLRIVARAPAWEALDFSNCDASVVIIAEAAPSRAAARHIISLAAAGRRRVFQLDGDAFRALRIGDLIGRTLGDVDWAGVRALIAGRRVLVTGGGGSIGGELTRRIASFAPERLCVLESSEFNLYKIGQELPSAALALCDVRDAAAIRRVFERERPDLVFHAAALKHVPLVESNPSEGVLTNVIGSRNVADAAQAIGAHMVFVSTDKAVNPSGVMGATKRLGEIYCQALDRIGGPRCLPVRLGNVLGSAGSVTPLFESQLAAGGPLTVTDPTATRYFITIPQAADFLLQAAAVGVGAESGRGAIFVLDMGEPLSVLDLAGKLIELEGLRPEVDVPISIVGMRPGEKLHEQLVADDEWREPDPAAGVMAAASDARDFGALKRTIDHLMLTARNGEDSDVVAALRVAVAPIGSVERAAEAHQRQRG